MDFESERMKQELFQTILETYMMKNLKKQNKFIVYREYMNEVSVEKLREIS